MSQAIGKAGKGQADNCQSRESWRWGQREGLAVKPWRARYRWWAAAMVVMGWWQFPAQPGERFTRGSVMPGSDVESRGSHVELGQDCF